MAFSPIEISTDEGLPIVLYQFRLGMTLWNYCSATEPVTFAGSVYQPQPISSGGVKQSPDASSDALTIDLPARLGVAQVFIGTPPSSRVTVGIRHMHAGDTDAPLIYVGEISQVDMPQPGTARLTCQANSATLAREGLRLSWQRTCPFALYDLATCKVLNVLHRTQATLLTADAGVISAAEFAELEDGALDGGYIEWEHPVRGTERRGIESHLGAEVTLLGLTDGLYHGLSVWAYRGCNRTPEVCNTVFNNLMNYGGTPHMPGKSPFDGDPVF